MKKLYILLFVFIFACKNSSTSKEFRVVKEEASFMTNEELGSLIKEQTDKVNTNSRSGYWEFQIKGKPLICITDVAANRMRIISPIAELNQVTQEQLHAALAANFHSALDVRYAVSNGVVWSAFIHPLRELSKGEVKSAISQVVNANLNFGTTYQSSGLFFNGGKSSEKKELHLQEADE